MTYQKIVKEIPVEKRRKLSEKLLDYLLKSKKEKKMPSGLAYCFLSQWQISTFDDEIGLAVLLEAAAPLEPEKTTEFLEQELQLANIAKAIKEAS